MSEEVVIPKQHWNYRVVRFPLAVDENGPINYTYSVVEAHYLDGKIVNVSSFVKLSHFEKFASIEWVINKIKEELDKPLLEYDKSGKLVEVT